jgi:hypothetical protein
MLSGILLSLHNIVYLERLLEDWKKKKLKGWKVETLKGVGISRKARTMKK